MKIFQVIFLYFSFLLLLVIFSVLISCQEQSESDTPQEFIPTVTATAKHQDVSSIDGFLDALYESITFSPGEEPDLQRFQSLFIPNAPFIRITPEGPHIINFESFVSSFQERVKSNALKSFYEAEIARKSQSFGRIAQVFSTYIKGINADDPGSLGRGINSIQLFHDGKRWWACSITWEDEREDNAIPAEYLH